MIRKLWLSSLIAVLGVMLLAAGVFAQAADTTDELEGPTVLPVTQPVSVMTPFTLTVLIPGDTGPITVEVPIMLQLSMSVTLGSDLTATVSTTPTIDIVGADETEAMTEDEPEATATPVATAAPTATPVPTVAPTATPAALPTSTPAGADEEEADPTATPEPEENADEETADSGDEAADESGDEAVTIAPVCPDSRSVITSPGVNEVVSGDVTMTGTAVHETFDYYKIEYAEGADPDNTGEYAFLTDGRVQVSDGELATFDSTELTNGTYTLRLSVVDNTGNFPPPCAVTIVIEN